MNTTLTVQLPDVAVEMVVGELEVLFLLLVSVGLADSISEANRSDSMLARYCLSSSISPLLNWKPETYGYMSRVVE